MIDALTPVFQEGAKMAIEINTQFFGIDCKVYYPSNTKVSEIQNETPEYNDVPDLEIRLLIPDLYNQKLTPKAGLLDNLYQESYIAYVPHSIDLPYESKIVATSQKLGTIQFIVNESNSVSTFVDVVYREVTLTPYLTYTNNDADANAVSKALADEFIVDATTRDYNIEDYTTTTGTPSPTDVVVKYRPVE